MAESKPGSTVVAMNKLMHRMQNAGHVDQMLRNTLQMCWMALPQDRQTVEELESQMRRLLDRAIRDLREDEVAFGQETG